MFREKEVAYLLSLICVIKPSTVVTSPPMVPLASSKSSSGTCTLAVSDYSDQINSVNVYSITCKEKYKPKL